MDRTKDQDAEAGTSPVSRSANRDETWRRFSSRHAMRHALNDTVKGSLRALWRAVLVTIRIPRTFWLFACRLPP